MRQPAPLLACGPPRVLLGVASWAVLRCPLCSWPALLATLLYSSRTLVVAGWGAFGFALPLPLFVAAQGAHVALSAWRLAPALCRPGGTLAASADKLHVLALLLDWPLRLVGGDVGAMPPQAACLALTMWTQVAGALVLPTAVLLWQNRRQAAAVARMADSAADLAWQTQESERLPLAVLCVFAAQLAWLLLRIVLAAL